MTGRAPVRERKLSGRAAFRLLVSAVLLTILIVLVPWDQVRTAAAQLTVVLYAVALVGFLLGHAMGAVKWRLMLGASGRGARLSARDTASCYGAGLFSNLFLPSVVGGDVVRATLAARALGRPEAVILGSVADRLIDFASLGLLIAGGALFAGAELVGWAGPVAAIVGIVLLGGGILLFPLALRRPLARWPPRIRRRAGRTLVALRRLARQPRPAILALILSLSMQSAFVVISAWLGWRVGADASLAAWFVVWPLAKVAAMLPVSLGGLGVRDAALTSLLVPFGVPAAIGLVASLAWNAVLIGGALVAGLVAWLLPVGRARFRTRSMEPPVAASASSPE